jgi:DNA-binding transcriptional LysR family regulator
MKWRGLLRVHVSLVEEGFDLTLSNDSMLIGRDLGRYQMWLCASPDYLAPRGAA